MILIMRFPEIESHLKKFRAGIAGAGGLGSNCAVALARSGIGTLVIADFDVVEPANLNRQYYFADQTGLLKTDALKETISRINPGVSIITCNLKLDESNITEVFAGCDVIVEAFDKKEMKVMLIETVLSEIPGVPLVVGSGLAGYGSNETIRSRKIDDTLYVCGDEATTADDDLPPMAPRVGIVANMQANTVIEILMQRK
ncbi:MAG: thiamine biosynthesis protein ThiF [Bacteroidetes bacterium RBG_13_43_22]|nr:MAG: thiamine biosynthesis protein ThiF [Bacteroidetes bacterium RBG_13_43_22]